MFKPLVLLFSDLLVLLFLFLKVLGRFKMIPCLGIIFQYTYSPSTSLIILLLCGCCRNFAVIQLSLSLLKVQLQVFFLLRILCTMSHGAV